MKVSGENCIERERDPTTGRQDFEKTMTTETIETENVWKQAKLVFVVDDEQIIASTCGLRNSLS